MKKLHVIVLIPITSEAANLPFKHQWIFILDADQVPPPKAESEF